MRGDVNSSLSILTSAMKGDMVRLQKCIDKGIDVNFQGPGGFTALIHASGRGHIKAVEYLINHGANSDIQENEGHTALASAALQNHKEIVELLINSGADKNIIIKDGLDILSMIQLYPDGFEEILSILQSEKSSQSILTSATHGDLGSIKKCIENGIDINFQDANGFTALILASSKGHLEIVKYLLDNGADINIKTELGPSALGAAAIGNNIDILKVLAKKTPQYEIVDVIYNLEQSYDMEESDFAKIDEAVSILKSFIDKSENNENDRLE